MVTRTNLYGWTKLRWKILYRDKYTCQYCGQAAPNVQLEVDHIIPLSEGGADDDTNLITSCWACNRGKNGLARSIYFKEKNRKRSPTGREAVRRNAILDMLSQNPDGLGSKEIVERSSASMMATRVALSRLHRDGKIEQISPGRWRMKQVLL
ncbi:hypothetical protein LCGC14_0853100 [marine sediment metagenome]|uniref:HNH nuclease domain-containing protein n=1 Tax=marine sediment metagenome TaxID=412755 RepID=A0A0F9SGP7_9ZZZZ